MTLPSSPSDRLLSITLALGQYPMLSARIRARMRTELFNLGVVDPQEFENEVRADAIQSQRREGVFNPLAEEAAVIWEQRQTRVRDFLTDVYFGQHLSLDNFEKVIREVLSERGLTPQELALSINPELAPLDVLLEQALAIERLPEDERAKLEPRLRESKVVLIRTMISDQLAYINIAKQWFRVSDLADIRRRKIGAGRIGGKAAGMLLAYRILKAASDEKVSERLSFPESYFLGSDLLYTFMSINNLVHWNDQKYKPEQQMVEEYPEIQKAFQAGVLPSDVLERLAELLDAVAGRPLIVRSSSLLEDSFGTSFAGKYDSIYCPNQGTPDENLKDLTRAIIQIYTSIFNPSALVYRRSKGLQDYDERMAILIQTVEGERYGRYFMPEMAGVAFSRNLYRWSPQIREEDGFLRLVWGLGTRAVDRVGNDYPRLVALSHPLLRPSAAHKLIRRYTQQYIDLIDLESNCFRTLPVHEVLHPDYPPLRFLAQLDQEGYFSSLRTRLLEGDVSQLTLTFEDLLRRTTFAETMRAILQTLEANYHYPVDVEFTARVEDVDAARPNVQIAVIQCRPQAHLQERSRVHIPEHLAPEDVLFSTHFMVPRGYVRDIRFILYVPSDGYYALPTSDARGKLRRAISQANLALKDQVFICIGPGRWGTTNPDLGVPIEYADIYNSRALVELTGRGVGTAPEPSFGTHFFQDLLEAHIFPLAVNMDDENAVFNQGFFSQAPSCLSDWIPTDASMGDALCLIDIHAARPGCRLDLIMENAPAQAVAFLARSG
ncbi:MAG TPA: PEP/pyruvate-binding domain-containing protein [Anaerolineaceae bacterium]